MKKIYAFIVTAVLAFSTSFAIGNIEGFERLEYLDTTGKEWFDTGLKASGVFDIDAKLQSFSIGWSDPTSPYSKDAAPKYAMFGGGDAANKNVIMACASCRSGKYVQGWSYYYGEENLDGTFDKISYYSYNDPFLGRPTIYKYSRTQDKSKVTLNYNGKDFNNSGVSVYHTASSFVSTNNFYIAAVKTTDFFAYPGVMRIWYFKIINTSDNTILRDYIPCRRKADGVVGLYDKVNGEFCVNASGEGACTAGPLACDEWVATDDGVFNYGVEWTLSGYAGSSTLSNVPVLLKISESKVRGFSYSQCLEGGADIAFSSKEDFSDRLPLEIDEWNPGGTSLVWVKVPTISGKTTKVYMRWGRSTPAGNLPSTEVWADYLGVYHMNKVDEETKMAFDSSPFARHAVHVPNSGVASPKTPTCVNGKVGKALNIPGDAEYQVPSPTDFHDKYDYMPLYCTVSIWAKKSKFSSYKNIIASFENLKYNNKTYRPGWAFQICDVTAKCRFYYGKAGAAYIDTYADEKEWWYRAMSTDGVTISVYRNGVADGTKTTDSTTSTYGGIFLGGVDKPISISGSAESDGAAQETDEVRYSRTYFTNDRIKADYDMMVSDSFAVSSAAHKYNTSLAIDGTQKPYNSDDLPYGLVEGIVDGQVIEKTSPEYIILDQNATKRAFCMGWELYKVSTEGEILVRSSSNTQDPNETKTRVIITIDGAMKLVWLFGKNQSKITASLMVPEGYDAENFSCEEWLDLGSKVNISHPEGFRAYAIDVTGKNLTNEDISSPQTVKMYFIPNSLPENIWLYDTVDKKLISPTIGWQFVNVTCNANRGLTFTKSPNHTAPSNLSKLDFSLPIYDENANECILVGIKGVSGRTKDYEWNLFDEKDTDVKSAKASEIIFPKTLTSAGSGVLQFFDKVTYFEFLGDYKVINTRMFYKANACKRIRFHYFPPTPNNESEYTFESCGAANYKFRIEYPKFLENAWLNTTNMGARYNIKLTGSEYNAALSAYRSVFGNSAEPPQGWAYLNLRKGVNAPERKSALYAYEPEDPTDKVVLGVMGLPWDIAQDQAKVMQPNYGYHEFEVGEGIPITPPRYYVRKGEDIFVCKGFTLHNDPDVIIPYKTVNSLNLPAGNYGLTWIYKKGGVGFKLSVR